MADVDFPTLDQIVERSRSDIRKVLPGSDPGLEQSFIRAIVDSNSGRSFDMVLLQKQLLDQAFPQTAVGEFLENWAGYNNLQRRPAQPAVGGMVIEGTNGAIIPISTTFISVAGEEYNTQAAVTISAISQVLLTANAAVDGTVTCTTLAPHFLATGIAPDFTNLLLGANTVGAVVTIINSTSFTYIAPGLAGTGDVLDTGAQYAFSGASVQVESDKTGLDQNAVSGSPLSIVTPIAGVDADGFVDFGGVIGGTDEEAEDPLRVRILERRANPVANFNESAINQQAKLISAVTTVHILPLIPFPGAVTIFFFVSDTASGIPNASQITAVRDSILLILPITTDPLDVIVDAPNVVAVAHTIDALVPTDSTMKDAITANLQAFYEDEVEYGVVVTTKQLENIIQNSQDLTTGRVPQSFTLVAPAVDVAVTNLQIATFGSVSYT